MESNRATLLGLPTELRLKIYDYVLSFDTGRLAIYDPAFPSGYEWRFKYEGIWKPADGDGTRIVRHDASLPQISWLSLLSTCSTIREELRGHMRSPAAAVAAPMPSSTNKDEAKDETATGPCHTYELRITASRTELASSVFLSLPCYPAECRQLTAHITLPGDVSLWGDNGPTPIVRELYQTLNRFLHCGPMLSARTPLQTGPIKLGILRLVVYAEGGSDGQRVGEGGWNNVMEEVSAAVFLLQSIGIPGGLVGRVVIVVTPSCSGLEESMVDECVLPHCSEYDNAPDEWAEHGFEWGVAGSDDTGQK